MILLVDPSESSFLSQAIVRDPANPSGEERHIAKRGKCGGFHDVAAWSHHP